MLTNFDHCHRTNWFVGTLVDNLDAQNPSSSRLGNHPDAGSGVGLGINDILCTPSPSARDVTLPDLPCRVATKKMTSTTVGNKTACTYQPMPSPALTPHSSKRVVAGHRAEERTTIKAPLSRSNRESPFDCKGPMVANQFRCFIDAAEKIQMVEGDMQNVVSACCGKCEGSTSKIFECIATIRQHTALLGAITHHDQTPDAVDHSSNMARATARQHLHKRRRLV